MRSTNLESIEFDTSVDSLLQVGKYLPIKESSVTSSGAYYSYDLDIVRFGHVTFTGNWSKEFYQSKTDQQADVYFQEEAINRIDIYPSTDDRIDAICLEINNRDEGMALLQYLNKSAVFDFNLWVDKSANKTYVLSKKEWSIDETRMLTLNFCIIRSDAKVDGISLVSLFEDYYE